MPTSVTIVAAGTPQLARASTELLARGGSFKSRVIWLMLGQPSGLKWLVGGALVVSIFDMAGPWLSSKVIDVALPDQATHLLTISVVLVMVATLHTTWAGWLHEKVKILLFARVEAECLELVLKRFLHMPFERAQRQEFGDTSETMSAVSAAAVALLGAAVVVMTELASILLMLILLTLTFPILSGLVIVLALSMLAVASAYAAAEARLAQATLAASSREQQTLHVLLCAVATLRASGATERFLTRWKRQLSAQTHAAISQQNARVSQGVVFEGFSHAVALGAMAWLVSAVISQRASLGEMMMGSMLTGNIMGGFITLARAVLGFQAMGAHFQRVDQLLGEGEQPIAPRQSASPRSSMNDDLVVERVWFRYGDGARWVLEEHSCRFPAHQLSELRAASGAGKTTLLRLLAGLLEPERGTVRVLGRAPRDGRQLITYLPQQSALLEASIATNLRVLSGRPLEEALEIAQYTGLSELLDGLPMHAETLVSMAGGNLSAGQRQLILLTAAFARGRPLILLDEATSQLDAKSQQRIDWGRLTRDKTVILVRHD